MQTVLESELAGFLRHLSDVQTRTLDVLGRKAQLLVAGDATGLAAVSQEEEQLLESLQQCLDRREELLQRAGREGLPSRNVQVLSGALAGENRGELMDQVHQARIRARLLQHQSLVNWVLVQKTLIHLSQLLEIIATGGRLQPTYGRDEGAMSRRRPG